MAAPQFAQRTAVLSSSLIASRRFPCRATECRFFGSCAIDSPASVGKFTIYNFKFSINFKNLILKH